MANAEEGAAVSAFYPVAFFHAAEYTELTDDDVS